MPEKNHIEVEKREILFTEEEIQERVAELGEEISWDYKDEKTDLVLLTILNGAAFFGSDLSREITKANQKNNFNNYNIYLDFMGVSSYGEGKESSKNPKITKEADIDIEGKNVLIIEDLIDTGYSMRKLLDTLSIRNPKSIKVCALLSKESKREINVPLDYCGFKIPDYWVEGYCMDSEKLERTHPFIQIGKKA